MRTKEMESLRKGAGITGTAGLDEAKRVVRYLGYTIVMFRKEGNPPHVEELLSRYKLKELSQKRKCFKYSVGSVKLIFLHENLHEEYAARLLFHEVGHIHLKHVYTNQEFDDIYEMEADDYARNFRQFARRASLRAAVLKIAAPVLALVFLTCLFLTQCPKDRSVSPPYTASPEATAQTDPETDTVYVTATGHKYHKRGCSALADSCIPIPREEAKKHYAPCAKCHPE